VSARATLATARRVLAQIRADPRTAALLLLVPLVLIGLLAWISDGTPMFDRIGGALLGIFPFVVMFIVTSVATLRERTSGTLERLLSTPLGKGDFLCGYALDQGYDMRFALEPKPNEPRGDSFLPTVGHALAFIERLEHRDIVGVNPELAHETMVGLSFHHAVALALWADKLFHVDLNAQRIGRFDQDLRFGAEELKEAFFVVRLLEDSGYDGPRHFDAHPLRVEDREGVWSFAAGCMRTYLALADKARRFAADEQIIAAMEAAGTPDLGRPAVGPYSREAADRLLAEQLDGTRRTRGYANDRLDQLTVELLLGLR